MEDVTNVPVDEPLNWEPPLEDGAWQQGRSPAASQGGMQSVDDEFMDEVPPGAGRLPRVYEALLAASRGEIEDSEVLEIRDIQHKSSAAYMGGARNAGKWINTS